MNTFRLFLVILALAVLGGCAGPAASAPVLVGTTIPITGPKAEEGRATRDGYLLFVDAINRQGGLDVGGRKRLLKLLYYDDRSGPQQVGALYTKLIEQDRVDFLLGPYSSRLTQEAIPLAETARIPMINAHGSAEGMYSAANRYTFSIISPARSYLQGVIDMVRRYRPAARTVALIGADEPFAREVIAGADRHATANGLEVVYRGLYQLNAVSVGDTLLPVRDVQPDVLLVAGHLQDAILVVRQARELGIRPALVAFTSGPSTPEFRDNLQSYADYMVGATQWTSALSYRGAGLWPTSEAYAADFLRVYPDYGQVPYQTAESTAALLVLQAAIAQAGTTDREAVRNALVTLNLMTFYGPVTFDARGVNVTKPMAVEQWFPDGKRYTVFPPEVAERTPIFPER